MAAMDLSVCDKSLSLIEKNNKRINKDKKKRGFI